MTNKELIKQFYDGDKAALHALYEQNTGLSALRKNLCKIKNCDKNVMMEWLKN